MRFGAILFDQDEFISSGYMYLDGEVSYIDGIGRIPGDALLLSNLAIPHDHQRIVQGSFVGLPSSHSILRWSAELGDLVFKDTDDQRITSISKESLRAHDPQKSVKNIGRLFYRMMKRLTDAGLSMDRWIPYSVADWMTRSWSSDLWSASQSHASPSLAHNDQQAGALDYWVKRSLSPRRRMCTLTLSWDRIRLAKNALETPLPVGQWTVRKQIDPHDIARPMVVESTLIEVPEAWSNWWIPGSSGGMGRKGKRVRNMFASPEWLFMQNIGVQSKPSAYHLAEGYSHFSDLFPKAYEFLYDLSPFSWVDQKIATCMQSMLDVSEGRQQKAPARLWVRSRSLIQQLMAARQCEEALQSAGLTAWVTGYGSGKMTLMVLEEDRETVIQWALMHGLFLTLQAEKVI